MVQLTDGTIRIGRPPVWCSEYVMGEWGFSLRVCRFRLLAAFFEVLAHQGCGCSLSTRSHDAGVALTRGGLEVSLAREPARGPLADGQARQRRVELSAVSFELSTVVKNVRRRQAFVPRGR
jgi:hypothetical protein